MELSIVSRTSNIGNAISSIQTSTQTFLGHSSVVLCGLSLLLMAGATIIWIVAIAGKKNVNILWWILFGLLSLMAILPLIGSILGVILYFLFPIIFEQILV